MEKIIHKLMSEILAMEMCFIDLKGFYYQTFLTIFIKKLLSVSVQLQSFSSIAYQHPLNIVQENTTLSLTLTIKYIWTHIL